MATPSTRLSEREQRKRLKRGWQQLERETTSAEAAETETVLGPALPPYLLERGMLVGDEPSAAVRAAGAMAEVPTYVDLDALHKQWRCNKQ